MKDEWQVLFKDWAGYLVWWVNRKQMALAVGVVLYDENTSYSPYSNHTRFPMGVGKRYDRDWKGIKGYLIGKRKPVKNFKIKLNELIIGMGFADSNSDVYRLVKQKAIIVNGILFNGFFKKEIDLKNNSQIFVGKRPFDIRYK